MTINESLEKSFKTTGNCGCLEGINKELGKQNATVSQSPVVNFKTGVVGWGPPSIRLQKIESRRDGKKLPIVLCSYCPFCGTKYGTLSEK